MVGVKVANLSSFLILTVLNSALTPNFEPAPTKRNSEMQKNHQKFQNAKKSSKITKLKNQKKFQNAKKSSVARLLTINLSEDTFFLASGLFFFKFGTLCFSTYVYLSTNYGSGFEKDKFIFF